MTLTIEDATKEDLTCILNIMNEEILKTTNIYDTTTRNDNYIQTWFSSKQSEGYPVLVARVGHQVIGYATYGPFRPFEGYRFTVEHSIYLAKEHQHKGLGRNLMTALIDLAKVQGFHVMVGGIDAANVPSITFHKKAGFTEVGRLPQVGRKFDQWLDLVLMQLLLK